MIGQSHWVDIRVLGDEGGYHLTFVAGSGDCQSGCIDHAFVSFRVLRDGTVEKLCEWRDEGQAAEGTPC
jgi:hypothetical protein